MTYFCSLVQTYRTYISTILSSPTCTTVHWQLHYCTSEHTVVHVPIGSLPWRGLCTSSVKVVRRRSDVIISTKQWGVRYGTVPHTSFTELAHMTKGDDKSSFVHDKEVRSVVPVSVRYGTKNATVSALASVRIPWFTNCSSNGFIIFSLFSSVYYQKYM